MSNNDLQDLQLFEKKARDWVKKNKPAAPKDFVLPETFMEVGTEEQFSHLREWQAKLYQAGFLGLAWPSEYGGGSYPDAYQKVVDRVLLEEKTPFMLNIIGLSWAGPVILLMGSEEQKKRYIKNILSADEIWCQGFSEPDHGSDLGMAQFKAAKEGDQYRLNGTKIWTTFGSYADHMILLARTNNDAPNKYLGLSFLLSPMKIDGVEPVPIQKITGEYGFTETHFTDALIPEDCLIGKEGQGWQIAMATLAFERGAEEGQAGGHNMVLIQTQQVVDMAKGLKRDGQCVLEDPIIRDQLVRFFIEEKSLLLNADRTKVSALSNEWPGFGMMSFKLQYSEFRRKLAKFAVSLQGNHANLYMGDPHAIERGAWQRSYFNGFSATIGGGTSQIQKNIIGERIMGLAKG